MKLIDRHQRILEILKGEDSISVVELSEILNVSSVTIRKDLAFLEEQKLLYRAHGKAIRMDPYIENRHVNDKKKLYPEEKERIAIKAIELLKPNDAIIIASGTTVLSFASNIKGSSDESLTVISSSVNATLPLLVQPNIEVIQLGGIVRPSSTSVVGDSAVHMLRQFSCSKLFLGVDGIDLEFGLTTTSAMEAAVNRAMIDAAQKVIVLTDSSKFGRRGFSRICNLDCIDYIITDTNLSKQWVEDLENLGINVILV